MREFDRNQPVAWPANFPDLPQSDFANEAPFQSEAERLLAVRKGDEAGLQFLINQKALYIDQAHVPYILKADMDMFRLRLAMSNELGEKLPPEKAKKNIEALIEGNLLHNNGVANLLIKDFE